MSTSTLDVVDVGIDHANLSVDTLPRSANLLGCRQCGQSRSSHGIHLIHRFVRPTLPTGHAYLTDCQPGTHIRLRRVSEASMTVDSINPAHVSGLVRDLLHLETRRDGDRPASSHLLAADTIVELVQTDDTHR